MDEQVKGLRSTHWYLQNSRGDIKCSIGNRLHSIVVTMYGDKWVLGISEGTLCKVYECLTAMLYP